MKFTKKEIKDIKYYFDRINTRLEINKIYENKNAIPEFIKINLINLFMEIIMILIAILLLTILAIISIVINDKNKKIKLLKLKSFIIIEKSLTKRYNIIYRDIIKSFNKRRKNEKF